MIGDGRDDREHLGLGQRLAALLGLRVLARPSDLRVHGQA